MIKQFTVGSYREMFENKKFIKILLNNYSNIFEEKYGSASKKFNRVYNLYENFVKGCLRYFPSIKSDDSFYNGGIIDFSDIRTSFMDYDDIYHIFLRSNIVIHGTFTISRLSNAGGLEKNSIIVYPAFELDKILSSVLFLREFNDTIRMD